MRKVFQHYRSKMTEYTACEAESRTVRQEILQNFYKVKDC